MSRSPVSSAHMCGYTMTVNTFEIMCEVADCVGIGVSTYAEIADVFTMTLMYREVMEEKIEAKMCKAFPSVEIDQILDELAVKSMSVCMCL